jgi:hypothetical protein
MKPIVTLVKAAHKSFAAHFGKAAAHHELKAGLHEQAQDEHEEMAECHKTIAGIHKAAGAGELHTEHMKLHKGHMALAAHHGKLAKAHGSFAEHCKGMAAAHGEAEKAVKDDASEEGLHKVITEGLAELTKAQAAGFEALPKPIDIDSMKKVIGEVVQPMIAEQLDQFKKAAKVSGLDLVSRDGKKLDTTQAVPAADAIEL